MNWEQKELAGVALLMTLSLAGLFSLHRKNLRKRREMSRRIAAKRQWEKRHGRK